MTKARPRREPMTMSAMMPPSRPSSGTVSRSTWTELTVTPAEESELEADVGSEKAASILSIIESVWSASLPVISTWSWTLELSARRRRLLMSVAMIETCDTAQSASAAIRSAMTCFLASVNSASVPATPRVILTALALRPDGTGFGLGDASSSARRTPSGRGATAEGSTSVVSTHPICHESAGCLAAQRSIWLAPIVTTSVLSAETVDQPKAQRSERSSYVLV
mmetsp:Transcript_11688/g.30759  ORF Transcript_11688/g.30759 Transcript_11688/m.30759 type:complete len:223 (+) Transcript_11688:623-1291(+)